MNIADQNFIRAFIAINLPQAVKTELETFQRKLKSRIPADWIKWTAPEQIHLTLRFLGNINAGAVPQLESVLRDVCARVQPFELAAENFSSFPEGTRPRVLWVGVSGQLETLNQLAQAIIRSTASWGESEDRQFQAHLTIGRVKTKTQTDLRKLAEILAQFKPGRLGQWQVTQIDVMQSQLYPTGPVYTCIATAPLKGCALHTGTLTVTTPEP